jgi:hypothetical protein
MVDSQAGDQSLLYESEYKLVDRFENRVLLHANGSEIVDVEKPSIVDFVCSYAPEAKSVRLFR